MYIFSLRVLIVVLVSFGVFFGYICRYNLSLVIEKMVVNVSENSLDESLPRIEEQAVAQLSAKLWYRKRRFSKTVHILPQLNATGARLAMSFDVLDVSKDAHQKESNEPNSKSDTQQNSTEQAQDDVVIEQGLLRWSPVQRNELLTAFFNGYVIFQIPAGRVAELYGTKLIFLLLALGNGLGSLIFPLVTRIGDGYWCAFLIRFILGASQAGMVAAAYVMLCSWLPTSERSMWLAVPSASGRFGAIVMFTLAPILQEAYSWQLLFYISGIAMLIWGVIFFVLVSDSPDTSRWISKSERVYLSGRMNSCNTKSTKSKPISWLKLISNIPMLILALVMFASEWSNMLLIVKLPGFLTSALKMDLKNIGNWSTILMVLYCILFPLSSLCAGLLERANLIWLNSLRVRKLFELSAQMLQCTGCVIVALSKDPSTVFAALIIIMTGRSIVGGGQCLMPPELSKDYTGSVTAVANTLANTANIIGPFLISRIVQDETDHASWRNFWLISAALFAFAGLVFAVFGVNERQDFGKETKSNLTQSRADLVSGSVVSSLNNLAITEKDIKMGTFGKEGYVGAGSTSGAPKTAQITSSIDENAINQSDKQGRQVLSLVRARAGKIKSEQKIRQVKRGHYNTEPM